VQLLVVLGSGLFETVSARLLVQLLVVARWDGCLVGCLYRGLRCMRLIVCMFTCTSRYCGEYSGRGRRTGSSQRRGRGRRMGSLRALYGHTKT
jgi:hypothetical protein